VDEVASGACEGVAVRDIGWSWAWFRRWRLSAMSSSSLLVSRDKKCGWVGVGASDVPPLREGCVISRVGRLSRSSGYGRRSGTRRSLLPGAGSPQICL
jgi:hypothetical protein